MNLEEFLRRKYGSNEPIYADEIRFDNYSRSWIFAQIKQLTNSGILRRFDKGIYYFPEKMFFGETSLDPRKVVMKRFLSDGNDVYGYIAGMSLMNSVGISTQTPNMIEIVTNKESTRVRDIYIGQQRVRARRSRTAVTRENADTLQFLDLMNSINPRFMDETEKLMLRKYVKESGVTADMVRQYAGCFPARAMKNMMESGVLYDIAR